MYKTVGIGERRLKIEELEFGGNSVWSMREEIVDGTGASERNCVRWCKTTLHPHILS